MKTGDLTGVVLAGGRSVRMGRDKARLLVGGEPLWQRQRGVLCAAGATTVVFALRPRQRAFAPGLTIVRDDPSGIGPLGGLHAALRACRTPWLAVVAVDLPRIDARWYRRLARECHGGCGAAAQDVDGYFEPLAAIYPRTALELVERQIAAGQYSFQGLLRKLVRWRMMRAIRPSAQEQRRLENWNTGPLEKQKPANR